VSAHASQIGLWSGSAPSGGLFPFLAGLLIAQGGMLALISPRERREVWSPRLTELHITREADRPRSISFRRTRRQARAAPSSTVA